MKINRTINDAEIPWSYLHISNGLLFSLNEKFINSSIYEMKQPLLSSVWSVMLDGKSS